MKTVSGRVLSSKPISLSKATKIMSEFAFMDHGASPSMRAYLKLTAGSLNDLVLFHKDLKAAPSSKKGYSGGSRIAEGGAGNRVVISPISDHVENRMQGEREGTGEVDDEQRVDALHHGDANAHMAGVDSDCRQRKNENKVGKGDEGIERTNGDDSGVRMDVGGSERTKHHKEKKRYLGEGVERTVDVIENGSAGIQDGQDGNGLKGIHSEGKKHKGKNKEGGVNGKFGVNQDGQVSLENSGDPKQRSKRLINESDGGETDQKVVSKSENQDSRKRKNNEVQDAALVDSAEQQMPKKKKKRSEGNL